MAYLLAGLALPDAHSLALHCVLAAEAAEVLGVLADLDLLDLLAQTGTVPGAVLADNADLLCALGHLDCTPQVFSQGFCIGPSPGFIELMCLRLCWPTTACSKLFVWQTSE